MAPAGSTQTGVGARPMVSLGFSGFTSLCVGGGNALPQHLSGLAYLQALGQPEGAGKGMEQGEWLVVRSREVLGEPGLPGRQCWKERAPRQRGKQEIAGGR